MTIYSDSFKMRREHLIKLLLPKFGYNYILKGRTALILFHGCEEYPSEIELDCTLDRIDILDRITNPGYSKWGVKEIFRDKDRCIVSIDYGDEDPLDIYVTKIDKHKTINGIYPIKTDLGCVYDFKDLYHFILMQFIKNGKASDLYNICYLVNKFSKDINKYALEIIERRLNLYTVDELSVLLDTEVSNGSIKEINTRDFILETLDKLN